MSNDTRAPRAGDALQFDAAVHPDASTASATHPTCAHCKAEITDRYYDVQGTVACARCRAAVVALLNRGTPGGRATRAVVFGLLAMIAGAALYLGIAIATGMEFGLIGILVGFMVGWAVRRGAHGRGGRRYQLLAAALTYVAIAVTYIPQYMHYEEQARKAAAPAASDSAAGQRTASDGASATVASATEASVTSEAASASAAAPDASGSHPAAKASGGQLVLFAAVGFIYLAAVSPIKVLLADPSSNLIGLAILAFSIYQAWRMNARREISVTGPFRVTPADGAAGAEVAS